MTESVTTFAERLSHFALSVDIVTDDTFDTVRDLVVDNMRNELEAAYFGLMELTEVNNRPGLRTIWSSTGSESSTTIHDAHGNHTQQVCVAFDRGRPLWVVDKGGRRSSRRRATPTRTSWTSSGRRSASTAARSP